MRIVKPFAEDLTDLNQEIRQLVNIKADQQTGWLQSNVPTTSHNAVFRHQEMIEAINDRIIPTSNFINKTPATGPYNITGNLTFQDTPINSIPNRPASVYDVNQRYNELQIPNIILRDGSVPLTGTLLTTITDSQVGLNNPDAPYNFRPLNYSYMDVLLASSLNRLLNLIRYDSPGTLTDPNPAYDVPVVNFTHPNHAVNRNYVLSISQPLVSDNFLDFNAYALLSDRLRVILFNVNNQSDLNESFNKIATIQNIYNNAHSHIRNEDEIKIGWIVRRPDKLTLGEFNSVGRRSLRGQAINTELGPVTLPNLETQEQNISALYQQMPIRFCYISRKNWDVNWGQA